MASGFRSGELSSVIYVDQFHPDQEFMIMERKFA